jgi:Raf kinase inhibitor-like YbhB/YbcL family protein
MPQPSPSTQPSTGPSLAPSAGPFGLTSSAFAEGGSIPRKYSCDGTNVSPPLAWAGVPAAASALVLIVDDPDAHGFIHWVAFDIAVSGPTGGLAEGASTAAGAPSQGTNGFGKVGWGGPCPPSGTHHYRFRLLAVRQPLGLKGAPTADAVLAAAKGDSVAETTLTAT